jgi:hypothetical protein
MADMTNLLVWRQGTAATAAAVGGRSKSQGGGWLLSSFNVLYLDKASNRQEVRQEVEVDRKPARKFFSAVTLSEFWGHNTSSYSS